MRCIGERELRTLCCIMVIKCLMIEDRLIISEDHFKFFGERLNTSQFILVLNLIPLTFPVPKPNTIKTNSKLNF